MVNILHAKAAGCCQTSSLIGGFVGRHAKAVKTSQRRLRGSHYRPACNGFGPPCGLIAARFAPLPILFCVQDVFLVQSVLSLRACLNKIGGITVPKLTIE